MTLKDIGVGESATVTKVTGGNSLQDGARGHLLDMGVIPGSVIKVIKYAPMGDPIEVEVADYELTLRLSQAQNITVEPLLKTQNQSDSTTSQKSATTTSGGDKVLNDNSLKNDSATTISAKKAEHPGLGEEGIYHKAGGIPPIPKGSPLTFALVGNQNTGKTTLFNTLTGSSAHVGNFPGVTVEQRVGVVKEKKEVSIVDLPGIYSLSPYSPEEVVTRDFLFASHSDGVIDIIDATCVTRNLYLTMQLLTTGVPVVIALNMIDELNKNGGSILVNALEEELGVPVVPISAKTGDGVEELLRHVIHVARHHEGPKKTDYCDKSEDGGAVHRSIHAVKHLIVDHAERAKIPVRFAAEKLLEGDALVQKSLGLDQNELDAIGHISAQLEKERGLDAMAAIADMRFDFIKRVCKRCVIKAKISKEKDRSLSIDKVLTGKFTAIPCFIAIMAAVFFLTFCVLGPLGQGLIETLFNKVTLGISSFLEKVDAPRVIKSLVVDGVCTGVGSVLSFLPIIIILFFFLSMLEDLGYMARIAFVMDRLLRKIGLSGRSIVPMLLGFGCTVSAVMASRTLPSDRDRKLTILLTPFMSCSAKLPVYAYFCAAFFSPKVAALVMMGLYLLGIVLGIVAAFVYRVIKFRGTAAPFVMELPNYRAPSLRNTTLLLWEKTKDFLNRAFTIILVASLVIWFMETFSMRLEIVEDSAQSILSRLSGVISVIFKPLGFCDWRVTSSLITGFMAKETVVATISILFGSTQSLTAVISPLGALSLLVFCLLYTPCVASVAVIRREMGRKWAIFVVVGQCIIAYIAAFIVYLIGSLI